MARVGILVLLAACFAAAEALRGAPSFRRPCLLQQPVVGGGSPIPSGGSYGPWEAKNFSEEAIKNTPCAQDGKSGLFDGVAKSEKNPPPQKFHCREGAKDATCYSFYQGCLDCSADNFNKDEYKPWGKKEAQKFCMSWESNKNAGIVAKGLVDDVFGTGPCA